MAPRKPRQIGTAAETAVVRYLRGHGFPHAERRSLKGALDQGDVTGTPGLCWEIKGGAAAKNASDGQVTAWLEETEAERRNANAQLGILVLQRPGIGPDNAGRWWAILWTGLPYARIFPARYHLADAVTMLRTAGYGDPLRVAS